MPYVTDKALRLSLKSILATLAATSTASHLAGARLFHYQTDAFDGNKWGATVRRASTSADGKLKTGQIHAVIIARASQKLTRKLVGAPVVDAVAGYRLRVYQHFWDNGDADNSEDYLSETFDKIVEAIGNQIYLGFDEGSILKHNDLQLLGSITPSFNNEMAHVLDCFLGVQLRKPLASS